MANSVTATDSNQAPLLSSAPPVMMVPMQANKPRNVRPVPGIKGLSIATIVLASLTFLLGVTAAAVKARMAFLGNPIWSSLLNISFLVMVILSAVSSFQLFVLIICAAFEDPHYHCQPLPDYEWSYYYHDGYCTPQWTRLLVDITIILCALTVGVLNVISFSMTIYGTFNCCYTCCQDSTSTAAYNTNTWIPFCDGNLQQTMMATPIQQHPNPYQYTRMIVTPAVGQPQPSNQNPQPVYIMQPTTNISPPQPQRYAVSNYQPAQPPPDPSSAITNQEVSPMNPPASATAPPAATKNEENLEKF
ncbi:uncharacterized protein [Amphiura filiformis]|uniref:uncharacterized protein isoform X2 n=1 Tax=Amphiura filiformis TaxID=82378 RepID=UPI003B228203